MDEVEINTDDSSSATVPAAAPDEPETGPNIDRRDWYISDYDPKTCQELSVEEEVQRLQYLKSLEILDRPYCDWYNIRTGIAANITLTPWSCISLIDVARSWIFAGNDTFLSWLGDSRSLPRTKVICGHVVLLKGEEAPPSSEETALTCVDSTALVVPDAKEDPRFCTFPAVLSDNIRFYAGVPLLTSPDPQDPAGKPRQIGVLCVMDQKPRPGGLSSTQKRLLVELARIIMVQIEGEQKCRDEALREAILRRKSLSAVPDHHLLQIGSHRTSEQPALERKRSLSVGAEMSADAEVSLACETMPVSYAHETTAQAANACVSASDDDSSSSVQDPSSRGGGWRESLVLQARKTDKRQRTSALFHSKLSVVDLVRCFQLAESALPEGDNKVLYAVAPGTESLDMLVRSNAQVFRAALAAFHCTLDPNRVGPILVRIGATTSGELNGGCLPSKSSQPNPAEKTHLVVQLQATNDMTPGRIKPRNDFHHASPQICGSCNVIASSNRIPGNEPCLLSNGSQGPREEFSADESNGSGGAKFSMASSLALLASCTRELRGQHGCTFRHSQEEGDPEGMQSESVIWFSVPFEHAPAGAFCG
jgi:GAF domain-containing protein